MAWRYKAYPEYKESGVEWVGRIPSQWNLKKLKYLAPLVSEKATEKTNPIALEHIQSWSGKLIETNSEFEGDGTKFKAGDILFGKLRPYLAKVYLTVTDGEAIGDFHVMRPINSSYGKFLRSLMLTSDYISTVDASTYGAKMPRASWDFTSNLPLPFCSETEAEKIANFLDHETAKIDTLIAKQEKLIELLKEKRQAVISHAVTKGLNPDAPMKDSGVEWLGEVPEHWRVTSLRRFFLKMEQGKSPECESTRALPDQWGVLKTSCVNNGIFREDENKALPTHIPPHCQYEVKAGDVLMSRASGSIDLIGSVAKVQDTVREKILLSDKIFRIELSKAVSGDYFVYFMSSSFARNLIVVSISGAEGMANNITKTAILDFSFPLPPISEQKEISKFITKKLDVISRLNQSSLTTLELLKEKKTALISAAVTGKIDIRNWELPTGVISEK